MRALVAGGAGFIGSHLCERLLLDGDDVVCVDNLVTGFVENVVSLRDNPRFQFVHADVIQPIQIDGNVDAIYHLASPASPRGYLRKPLETALVNSIGSQNLLRLALDRGARFLLASTSEAYGDPLVHPQREDYWGNVNPNGIRSCYDEGKRFSEALTMVYVRQYHLDARIVRIFNCYGPRSDPDDGRLVPNFVTQALSDKPLTVYGDGSQTRSLCYVSDLIDGLVRVMRAPNAEGQVYNLGNPDERTILEFAEVVRRVADSSSPIEFREFISADDPQRRCPDISKARKDLDWEPRVGLDRGMEQTIEWFRARLAPALAR